MPSSEEISKELKQEAGKTEEAVKKEETAKKEEPVKTGETAKTEPASRRKAEKAADIPAADPAEDSRSALYWARKNFYSGKTGKMPSTDELFYGAEPIDTPPLSGNKAAAPAKDKKGGKKGGDSDSGSDDGGSSDGGNDIDVMDLNDL